MSIDPTEIEDAVRHTRESIKLFESIRAVNVPRALMTRVVTPLLATLGWRGGDFGDPHEKVGAPDYACVTLMAKSKPRIVVVAVESARLESWADLIRRASTSLARSNLTLGIVTDGLVFNIVRIDFQKSQREDLHLIRKIHLGAGTVEAVAKALHPLAKKTLVQSSFSIEADPDAVKVRLEAALADPEKRRRFNRAILPIFRDVFLGARDVEGKAVGELLERVKWSIAGQEIRVAEGPDTGVARRTVADGLVPKAAPIQLGLELKEMVRQGFLLAGDVIVFPKFSNYTSATVVEGPGLKYGSFDYGTIKQLTRVAQIDLAHKRPDLAVSGVGPYDFWHIRSSDGRRTVSLRRLLTEGRRSIESLD